MTTPEPTPPPIYTPLPDIPYLQFGEPVTLTNCDREPIHIPGHCQAHGAIVVIDPTAENLAIVQASANVSQFLGIEAGNLLGADIAALFEPEQVSTLRDALADGKLEANPLYLFTTPIRAHGLFIVTAHVYQGLLTLEMEPFEPAEASVYGQPDSQALLRQALAHLRTASGLSAYCQMVCESVYAISGFDRVMVYRFHEDGHGEVIAEVIGEPDAREAYLGFHYHDRHGA